MDPNRLGAAGDAAESMLVLSVVILLAVAALITSHLLSARNQAHRSKPVQTVRSDVEPIVAGAVPALQDGATAPPATAPVPAAAAERA